MKAKLKRGKRFSGVLRYAFVGTLRGSVKKARVVAATIPGDDAMSLSRQFEKVAAGRPEIAKPVWHCSLALPLGESLADERWFEVVECFMKKMDFPADTQFVAIRHGDTPYDHVHLIANRISLSGEVWLGRWDVLRAIQATQEIEREFTLTSTPGLQLQAEARSGKSKVRKNNYRSPSKAESEMAKRRGQPMPRVRLQGIVQQALCERPTWREFNNRLTVMGVEVRRNIAKNGVVLGISFQLDGVSFKGSQLGLAFAWTQLSHQFSDSPSHQ